VKISDGRSLVDLELIDIDPFFDANGWRGVRVAVNGVPAAPFTFHKSVHEQFLTDAAWLAYLARQGAMMISRGLIYGAERPQSPADGLTSYDMGAN
jgi:hypothetical protein